MMTQRLATQITLHIALHHCDCRLTSYDRTSLTVSPTGATTVEQLAYAADQVSEQLGWPIFVAGEVYA